MSAAGLGPETPLLNFLVDGELGYGPGFRRPNPIKCRVKRRHDHHGDNGAEGQPRHDAHRHRDPKGILKQGDYLKDRGVQVVDEHN